MKQYSWITLIVSSALLANSEVNTLSEVFSEAKTGGKIKYYYELGKDVKVITGKTSGSVIQVDLDCKYESFSTRAIANYTF